MQFCKSGETLIYIHLLFNFIVFVQCFHYNFTTVLVSGVTVIVFEQINVNLAVFLNLAQYSILKFYVYQNNLTNYKERKFKRRRMLLGNGYQTIQYFCNGFYESLNFGILFRCNTRQDKYQYKKDLLQAYTIFIIYLCYHKETEKTQRLSFTIMISLVCSTPSLPIIFFISSLLCAIAETNIAECWKR